MINMLIIINVVIAIMTDTYATMMEQREGLYNAKIIENMSQLKNNKNFGGLITAIAPLSIFGLLLLPFMLIFHNNKPVLQKITYYFCKVIFFPFSVFFTAMFLLCNCIMLPFAYLKSLLHKAILIGNLKLTGFLHFLLWLVVGPLILAFSLLSDTLVFFIQTYTDKSKSFSACEHLPATVTAQDLTKFRKFIEQKLAENKFEKGPGHPTVNYLNAKKLAVALNKEFFVGELIMNMIYEPHFIKKRENDRIKRLSTQKSIDKNEAEEFSKKNTVKIEMELDDKRKVHYRTTKTGEATPWPRKWTAKKDYNTMKRSLNTYNAMKNLIWSSVVNAELEDDKTKHVINARLLLGVVRELETQIRVHSLVKTGDLMRSTKTSAYKDKLETLGLNDFEVKYVLKILSLVDIKSSIAAANQLKDVKYGAEVDYDE